MNVECKRGLNSNHQFRGARRCYSLEEDIELQEKDAWEDVAKEWGDSSEIYDIFENYIDGLDDIYCFNMEEFEEHVNEIIARTEDHIDEEGEE